MSPRRSPGLADVAAQAGVSASLVSRILSKDPTLRVRPETRDRVLEAASRLHYVPHGAARALRLSRAGALGLVVHDVSNPIHAEIIRGAQGAAAEAGQVLLLAEAAMLASNTPAFDQLLGDGRIDALLWHGGGHDFDDELSARAAERLPTLLVNSRSRAGVPAIRLADDRAAGMAVDHLVGLGHREVGYVGGRPGSDLTVRRRAGWAETLGRHGLPVRDEWVVERDWDAEAGYAAATQLLSREDRPTSLFVANVVISVGALAAARDLGIRVPDELSVVAVHDVWFAAHDAPPLTTVRLPLQDMGRRAVELLLDGQVSGVGEPASEYVLDEPAPLLVTRASTAPPP